MVKLIFIVLVFEIIKQTSTCSEVWRPGEKTHLRNPQQIEQYISFSILTNHSMSSEVKNKNKEFKTYEKKLNVGPIET